MTWHGIPEHLGQFVGVAEVDGRTFACTAAMVVAVEPDAAPADAKRITMPSWFTREREPARPWKRTLAVASPVDPWHLGPVAELLIDSPFYVTHHCELVWIGRAAINAILVDRAEIAGKGEVEWRGGETWDADVAAFADGKIVAVARGNGVGEHFQPVRDEEKGAA